MSIVHYIEDHPIIGGVIWVASVIGNVMIKINYDAHIPALVMDAMQMVVWSVGLLAGLVTINGWYKNNYKKKKVK